jgi:hypothetical protein
MRFEEIVKHISEEFTQARNDWDMEPLMHFLHTNVSLQSPNVSEVYPENKSNTILGRDNVINYWNQLVEMKGTFKVTQLSIVKIDNKVTTMNQIEGSKTTIKECYRLDEYGKINEMVYEYSQP